MRREDVLQFMEQHYCLNNIVVCVVGNIQHEAIVEAVIKRLTLPILDGKPPYKRAIENQTEPEVLLKSKPCEETHLCMGIRSVSRTHPDFYVFQLINAILGGGMMSRLFQEVRDKRGLAYDVSTTPAFFQDTGAFIIYAGVDTERFSESIKVIKSELEKLKNGVITVEEISDAKAYLKGSLVLRLEDTAAYSGWLGAHILFHDTIITLDDFFARIDAITRDDIIRVCNSYFLPKHFNLAVISPHHDASAFKTVFAA
jgi:predicted Zn-dependent peptidase